MKLRYNCFKLSFAPAYITKTSKDSKVVDHNWQHKRVGGGRDRRYKFSNNKLSYICKYGTIDLNIDNITISLFGSSCDKMFKSYEKLTVGTEILINNQTCKIVV